MRYFCGSQFDPLDFLCCRCRDYRRCEEIYLKEERKKAGRKGRQKRGDQNESKKGKGKEGNF